MSEKWSNFFDPAKARGPRSGPDVGEDVPAPRQNVPEGAITVSALVGQIKDALTAAFPQRVTVVGEISNFKLHTSGHMYFRLKDADAAIDVTMFGSHARRLKFRPEDGLEVVAKGHVDVYEVRGQLQLRVERMTPKGAGALELAFRQLHEKLQAEGLFDKSVKKPIPRFPRAIGVVTSPTGAAIRDIRRTLLRRWPAATVYLAGSHVQGEGAGESIAAAIRLLDGAADKYQIDTIIVSRGGGSLEDLWAFNEEAVARAIFTARTAIISGVGHEIDVTIADLAADLRAATPTAAAEHAVPDAVEIRQQVLALAGRLNRTVADGVRSGRTGLDGILRSAVFRDPLGRVQTQMQRMDELSHRIDSALGRKLLAGRRRLGPLAGRLAALHPARLHERALAALSRLRNRMAWALSGRSRQAGDALTNLQGKLAAAHPRGRLQLARQSITALERQLDAMSHRCVLARGFSVTRKAGGTIVRSASEVGQGQHLRTELSDGEVDSRVIAPEGRSGRGAEPAAPAPRRRRAKHGQDAPTLFDVDKNE